MHTLLSRQLERYCPASGDTDLQGLSAAVDASYAGFERQLAQAGKMAALGQIAAGVAHEINNPLGYVGSNLDTLQEYLERLLPQDGDDAAQLRQDVAALLHESRDGMRRMRQMVQELLDYAHGGEAEQQWAWTDLQRSLDATLNMMRNALKYRAEIVKDYGAVPPVHCLPSQLSQVMMNLLANAAHALGPRRGRITLQTGTDGDGEAWFAVGDSGAGIVPEHLAQLFEPFFTTKPMGQGTGLGLSLAQQIVHRHGGRIEVSTELGKGSTFRVVLPLRHDGRQYAA
ncbi:MAG: ATP-binding protein [Pseudomonadota bacterium]